MLAGGERDSLEAARTDRLQGRDRFGGNLRGSDTEVTSHPKADVMLAEAEAAADEIRQSAMKDAHRVRTRANDDARSMVVQARRDALWITKESQGLADEIEALARRYEADVYGRVTELRRVVQKTEQLLKSVAAGNLSGHPEPVPIDDETLPEDIHVVVAPDVAPDPEELSEPPTESAEDLPESVRRLLDRLSEQAR